MDPRSSCLQTCPKQYCVIPEIVELKIEIRAKITLKIAGILKRHYSVIINSKIRIEGIFGWFGRFTD